MKVNKMNLEALRNEEHFQFMTDVKSLVEESGASTLNIDQLFPTFTSLYGKEDIALEVIRKSALTNPIADADSQRDSVYRGFTLFVEAYSHSLDTDNAQAAQNIQVVIDHYGDVRSKPYNEETAAITNFLQDINSRCADDITTLNAQEWIDTLSSANQSFDALMNERFDENAGQEIVNMRDARRAIDKTYTQMIDRVNASILLNGETAYADFVNKLNERIDYFKNTIAIRKGRVAAKNNKGEL